MTLAPEAGISGMDKNTVGCNYLSPVERPASGTNIWWHHQMKIFFALLALCVGNSPFTGEFPSQRPVMWSFDVFFDLHLNKRLSKQLQAGNLKCHHTHYDVTVMIPFCSVPFHSIQGLVQTCIHCNSFILENIIMILWDEPWWLVW